MSRAGAAPRGPSRPVSEEGRRSRPRVAGRELLERGGRPRFMDAGSHLTTLPGEQGAALCRSCSAFFFATTGLPHRAPQRVHVSRET